MALFGMDAIGTLMEQPAADKHTCIDTEVNSAHAHTV
jgi:hypothetical protein